jgi:hypothetical protein
MLINHSLNIGTIDFIHFGSNEHTTTRAHAKRDNRYQQDKKRKLCKRRAAIEPICVESLRCNSLMSLLAIVLRRVKAFLALARLKTMADPQNPSG